MRGKPNWLLLLVYILWGVFINAVNMWIIRPLAADFAILGILAICLLSVLWLSSLPKQYRRLWMTFTVYSLLLGDGLSELTLRPWSSRIVLSIVMMVGLAVLAWLVGRVRLTRLAAVGVVLFAANVWLPLDEWPLLTHFHVVFHKRVPFHAGDIPTLPIQVVHQSSGDVVVTLQNLIESQHQLEQEGLNATGSPDALVDMLRNYNHRYQFVELAGHGTGIRMQAAQGAVLRHVVPMAFSGTVFPWLEADWRVENGSLVQYMAPTVRPGVLADLSLQPGDLPMNATALSMETASREQQNWQAALEQMGEHPAGDLTVQDGHLVGTYQGQSLDLAVQGSTVIGEGAFTSPQAHEVLLQGVNMLQVVSLDSLHIAGTFHGDPLNPVSSDVVIGPVDNSGRDAIMVNASPAYVLRLDGNGNWNTVYTAPNPSFRFEASVKWKGDSNPEIIANDPSYLRNSPVRYLTSYTLRNGQLIRNWRVFQTNVVNIHTVQFVPGGSTDLVATLYGSGTVFVLQRHHWPVVPMAVIVLAASMLWGWVLRWRKGRGIRHGFE